MGQLEVKDLIIVGLGPGGMDTLSIGTLQVLTASTNLFIRTEQHPIVKELSKQNIQYTSFDDLYEDSSDFQNVYGKIAEAVLTSASKRPTVFAVPGHPLIGEESVSKIIKMAPEAGIDYEILPAMSFLDPVMASLAINLSEGLKLLDGLKLTGQELTTGVLPDPKIPNLIMQVYNRRVASEVKLSLMDYYPDEHLVTVIRAAGVPGEERVGQIPLFELDRLDWIDHLTSVYIPPSPDSKAAISNFPLDRMVDLLEQLRDLNGCPWDREQTHLSLKKCLIEETYEVLEAIDEGNMHKVCEELGDLLLQIVFHAQIARESGFFDMNDVVEVISEKLVRRHPHVFGNTRVSDSDEVSFNWEEIKKGELRERGEIRESLLDGVPAGMPALMKAEKIQNKAAKVGFDWPDFSGALHKVVEEIDELKEAIDWKNADLIQEELGDLLFSVVNLARLLKVGPEEALTGAIIKFKTRFMVMEQTALKSELNLEKMSLKQLDKLWEEAKIRLKENN